jgi:uncharacterized protein involved in exopolysaccharide biosynthesis
MRSTNLLEHVFECLKKYKWVWIVPAIAGLIISGVYNKILATKTYTARQSLILRDDLLGDAFKPSRFESQESLKSAQETVLEIARKPQVIKAVLEQLGPASSWSFGNGHLSATAIETTQGNITLSAPNGGEFGKTEAVVLSVKTSSAQRSVDFMNLLLDEIDAKIGEVRLLRLQSMQVELSKASSNSLAALESTSKKLRTLERSFGSEITTIRSLNDPQGSGGFELKLNQIRAEQRAAAAQLSSAKHQRRLLEEARRSDGVEFVTSNELLQLQPALQGIMTNLSTAMAQLAINEGRYTELHPDLKRSRRAVEQQKRQLFDSIGTTIKGLDSQIETLSSLDQGLQLSIRNLENKLGELSEQRVPYAALEEEVKNKTEIYNEIEGRLDQIQSYAASSSDVQLLTRVDDPQVSSRPDQIGAFQAALIGGALGLIFGLGLVAMLAPPFVDPRTGGPNRPLGQSAEPKNYAAQSPARSAPSAAERPVPSTQATAETAAESRLKSVTAMQRTALQRASEPREQPAFGLPLEDGSVDQRPDSAIPDSIAQHMAAIKRNAEQAVPQQLRDLPQQEAAKPESTPPVAMPKLDVTQQSSSAVAAQEARSATGIAALAEASKRLGTPSDLADQTPVPQPANSSSSNAPSPVSSADVVAAFKNHKSNQATASAGSSASSVASPTDNLLSSTPAVARAGEAGRAADTPEIVVVDRAKSPHVPDSITKGRITAESLLKSSEPKSVTGDSASSIPPASVNSSVSDRFSSLAHDPVDANVPQGGIQNPDQKQSPTSQPSSRIPSVTDYAQSLDRQMEAVESAERIANAEAVPAARKSNIRPLDIARAVDDPAVLPKTPTDLEPEEASGNPAGVQNRAQNMSDLVSSMENSVAGLMRQAKGSSVFVDPVPSAASAVAPSEKAAPAPQAATPKPREETGSSAAIPQQIKDLSDSFTSFARPSNKPS